MIRRLRQFYDTFGDKGVMFVMFAFSVVVNALLSMYMELPAVHPDEIGVAGIAAYYSGHDWSGLMSGIGHYCGYIQALIYTPLFLFFENPYALYKAMLVTNGVIISLIPLIAYNIAARLGIESVRKKTVISLCCGFYITYITYSKFVWNEAVASLMPWLLIWCVMVTWQRSKGSSRFSMSILTGFMCAVAFAAHSRLIAVVVALVITVIIAQVLSGDKLVNMPAFLISLIVSFATENFAAELIKQAVWRGRITSSTFETEMWRLGGFSAEGGAAHFFAALFGQIYAFASSSAGLGAMAAVIAVMLIVVWLRESARSWKTPPERGTRVYDSVKHKYNPRLTVFALYSFLVAVGSILLSAVYKFSTVGAAQDSVIFGRYVENIAPLAIFLVMAFVVLYGSELKHILYGAGAYAVICILFAAFSYPMIKGEAADVLSVMGLLPWRIGEDINGEFTGISFVIISSCVLTIFALAGVFASCSRRRRTNIISGLVCCIFAYTAAFSAFVFLPDMSERNKEDTAPAIAVSELVYNDSQSPKIVFYQTETSVAGLVQFLDPLTKVVLIDESKDVPESCLLVAESGTVAPFEGGSYDVVGRTDEYTVYAYGEGARDFIRYKSAAGTTRNTTSLSGGKT